jgi:hypothetical protein
LILHLVLTLQQEIAPVCAELPLAALASELQGAYLKRLGLGPERLAAPERDTAFRAFLATREDFGALKAKLSATTGKSALDFAKAVYGHGELFRGTALVASKPLSLATLETTLKRLCPNASCPFWDSRTIYKVLVTEHGGLAAYVPETASLVLSRVLVEDASALHQLILVHELTHAAIRKTAMIEEKDWVAEFARFSGWGTPGLKAPKSLPPRNDRLTEASKSSTFSLLPDPKVPRLEAPGRTFEGLPLGRTLARIEGSGDLSEDLADSVAAYVVAPERFCDGKKPIAPGKWNWIGKNVFGKAAPLKCKGGRK